MRTHEPTRKDSPGRPIRGFCSLSPRPAKWPVGGQGLGVPLQPLTTVTVTQGQGVCDFLGSAPAGLLLGSDWTGLGAALSPHSLPKQMPGPTQDMYGQAGPPRLRWAQVRWPCQTLHGCVASGGVCWCVCVCLRVALLVHMGTCMSQGVPEGPQEPASSRLGSP